jgi:hypothetical protein
MILSFSESKLQHALPLSLDMHTSFFNLLLKLEVTLFYPIYN